MIVLSFRRYSLLIILRSHQKTVAINLLADKLQFWLLVGLRCVVVNSCFLHGYETAPKLFRIADEQSQTLLWGCHTIAFSCANSAPIMRISFSRPSYHSKSKQLDNLIYLWLGVQNIPRTCAVTKILNKPLYYHLNWCSKLPMVFVKFILGSSVYFRENNGCQRRSKWRGLFKIWKWTTDGWCEQCYFTNSKAENSNSRYRSDWFTLVTLVLLH